MIRLTNTGNVFLLVSVLLYLASLTSQSSLLLLLIGILLGCYGVNAAAAWVVVRRMVIKPPARVQIREGETSLEPWRIANPTLFRAGFIEATARGQRLLRVRLLPRRSIVSAIPELQFWKRGVYPYSEIRLSSVYPFGLVKTSRRVALSGEVVVHPAIYETPLPRAAGFDLMVGGKFKGRQRTIAGSDFAGIRPHQPGDPLRNVHWKTSSKGQGLMVKVYDEELSGRVSFVIDPGQSGQESLLDDCLRAMGSLAFSALKAGHHVEWISLHDLRPSKISPFFDGQELLDELARIPSTAGCLTARRLEQAIELLSRKSALILVLTEFPAEVQNVLHSLAGRVVSVYLPAQLPVDRCGLEIHRYTAKEVEA